MHAIMVIAILFYFTVVATICFVYLLYSELHVSTALDHLQVLQFLYAIIKL
jgi:hypothetical protein